MKKTRQNWDSWQTFRCGKEWQQSEGVVMQLLQHKLSERMIRMTIPVGGSRVTRLNGISKLGVETLYTRRLVQKPSHALSHAYRADSGSRWWRANAYTKHRSNCEMYLSCEGIDSISSRRRWTLSYSSFV